MPATSFFWQLAGNVLSQTIADIELVIGKKLHASTPTRITLLAGNSRSHCAARIGAHLRRLWFDQLVSLEHW
jgi:hypothetical protein